MYLREARWTNKDGSVVRYVRLAHSERRLDGGTPTAKEIHNVGRPEMADRDALGQLMASTLRLAPVQAAHGLPEPPRFYDFSPPAPPSQRVQ